MPGPRRLAIACVLVAASPVMAGRAQRAPVSASGAVRCDYGQKIECTSSGCQAAPVSGAYLRLPPLSALLDATARAAAGGVLPSIEVCDAAGCTPITVRAARGGAFVNIAQDGGAHFVKVAATDIPPAIHKGDFVEVAARFLTTATYVGACPDVVR
jgi:hypothetical protein